MKWPGKDNINPAPESSFDLPPEGRYNVTLTNATARAVSKGSFLVLENTIDSGPHKGHKIEDELWMSNDGSKMDTTWAKLYAIFENASWWPPLEAGEEIEASSFALLFPVGGENELRYSIDCVHEYSINAFLDRDSYKDYSKMTPEQTPETPYSKWLKIDKETFDSWEGKTWKKLVPRPAFGVEIQLLYGPPSEESERQNGQAPMVMDEGDKLPF